MKESKKSLDTPRPYLSWSQYNVFSKSPKTYVRIYIHGKKFGSSAMEFGKRFHQAVERNKDTGDRMVDFGMMFITRYELHEHKIEGVKTNGVPLLGILDGVNVKKCEIGEYKTGKSPWNQDRVNDHKQFDFYGALFLLKYKSIPKWYYLHWLDTKNKTIKSFKTKRSMRDLLEMQADMVRVWAKIKEVCAQEYSIIK